MDENLDRLKQQIDFIIEIDKLKGIVRQTHLVHVERQENVAEHSWHLAMLAMTLAEHANEPVDVSRVMKMVLIHDIVEIDAGDTFAYDTTGGLDQAEREQKAADRLFNLLPSDQATEYRALWNEFEARQSPDAKFAKALDRLMPLMHNYFSQGKGWKQHGIRHDQVMNYNRHMHEGSETLWHYAQSFIKDAVEKGYLKRD
ncbi:MAG: HD domain-containing protein [Chloroflexota bacterium]